MINLPNTAFAVFVQFKFSILESDAFDLFQLQTANVMLNERGSQLNLVQRDAEHQKSQHDRLQDKIRLEKVSTSLWIFLMGKG